MLGRERAAGVRLQVSLKRHSLLARGEGDGRLDTPRDELARVGAFSLVVSSKTGLEVGGEAGILAAGMGKADKDVDVMKSARHALGPAKAKFAAPCWTRTKARLRERRYAMAIFVCRKRQTKTGGRRGIRTHDPRIKNPLLCQLS